MSPVGRPMTSVEAARLIRADIKKAAGDGTLGDLPAGVTFGVTAPKMGLARPVVINVQHIPREWTHDGDDHLVVSATAARLAWSLRDLLIRHRQHGRVELDGWIQCGA